MKIIYSLEEDFNINQGTALALGTFDGVHIAHKEVIEQVVKSAKEHGLLSVVYTFSNHPKDMNPGVEAPKRLITPQQKIQIIESLGVDILFIVPFDQTQLNIEAHEFLSDVVVNKICAKSITVGYDFRFGKNAKGCVNLLEDYKDTYGYTLNVIEPIRHNGVVISSTMIRNYLINGDVKGANALLGRQYCIQGTVIHGKHMGRKLGYPTINLETEFEMSVLRPGVYVTKTHVDDMDYYSVTNVGFNPTFNQSDFTIETYILDFEGDLYDKKARISFLKYVRPEIKFDGLDQLIEKIGEDVIYTKEYFNLS